MESLKLKTASRAVARWRRGLTCRLALALASGWASMPAGALAAAPLEQTFADKVEMLDWSDPERAAQMLDTAAASAERRAPMVQMLEVRGMVYVDVHRDKDLEGILQRLHRLSDQGDAAATVGEHFVRAYAAYQAGQPATADVELGHIDEDSITKPAQRYRVWILRGNTLRMLGQTDAALPLLERSLDLAQDLHDDVRSLYAMLWLAHLDINVGNFERATAQLEQAQRLALQLGDEAAMVDVEGCVSDVEDRLGHQDLERRASLAALEHAKRAASNKWLGHALMNLGDSYLKSGDFAESLKYSKQALPLLLQMRAGGEVPVARFNEGLAYIGLGQIKAGEKLAEDAIAVELTGESLLDAREFLREYADALEHAGYLMAALQVYHRYDALSEKMMSDARQRTLLELSAKFDDERRARELELLRRDNELKASQMHAQRLGQQLILAGALLATGLCGVLLWAVRSARKANNRLRFDSERDALTGLRNRRYFNDNVLSVDGNRPVGGCVLLADLDHFKRINDTLGHPAGDAVLATVSHRLSSALRENDKLVRWGGEEFLAILDPITREQANSAVERLLHTVRRDPVIWNGQSIQCSISIGYAFFPMEGASTEISLDNAIGLVDKALYEAKRRGRNRACFISAVSALDERELTIISAEFQSAAADHRVELVETGAAA